ncbi:hypothetical protein [Streptomyces pseudovenezuelae]|uniref:DUF4388 domain-containing protein n=1 Tax=Streptomyces pseudovenezuelae TaxID=67350 RepID=A0ABT6LVN4_9ACTN|nr:hypothetical protein [Streptomyces pseudovenezuelae]MDH6220385.1 hypothetical protein [Streptomyces pseudovenezuelae]
MTEGPPEPLTGSRNIPSLLSALRSQERSCTVVVAGAPGGSIHVRDGLVVAMETPGAPSVEGLLLRSGRVSEEAWSSVRATDTTHEHLAAELVHRGLVGAGELEVVSLSALFDAAFALSLATPDSWEVTDPVPTLYRNAGVTPERLLAEVSRRINLLAGEPGSVAALARTRMESATAAGLPGAVGTLPARHQDVLANADGRRTARDIAFALGRGLFAVMVDLRQLLDRGLVRPRTPSADTRPSTAARGAPSAVSPAAPEPVSLPRRRPGNTSSPAPRPQD